MNVWKADVYLLSVFDPSVPAESKKLRHLLFWNKEKALEKAQNIAEDKQMKQYDVVGLLFYAANSSNLGEEIKLETVYFEV